MKHEKKNSKKRRKRNDSFHPSLFGDYDDFDGEKKKKPPFTIAFFKSIDNNKPKSKNSNISPSLNEKKNSRIWKIKK